MTLTLRKRIGHTARKVLPAPAYDFLWFYMYEAVHGVLVPARPSVQMFGGTSSNTAKALHARLQRLNVNAPTPLCWIMKSHGSDKGLAWHNYTTVYYALLAGWRKRILSFFELGLGTTRPDLVSSVGPTGTPGASIMGWAKFLPNARVFGADIDRDILFRAERIETFYCDQLDPVAIAQLWSNPALAGDLDVLLEDGLHTFEANTTFLEHSIQKIRRGGFYIVEDILETDMQAWVERISGTYAARYPDFAFFLVRVPWRFNMLDNNVMIALRLPD